MHNFLRLNCRLACVFFVLAILAVSQMIIFRSFAGVRVFNNFSPLTNWSFGSIGYPTELCSKAPLDWSQSGSTGINMVFECQAHTQIRAIYSSGIISYESPTDYEGLVEVFGKCYYDPDATDAHLFPYMQYFKAEQFNSELMAQCEGKNTCTATLSYDSFQVPLLKRTNGQFAFA